MISKAKQTETSNNEIVYGIEILYSIIQFVCIVTSSLNLIDQILTGCATIILHIYRINSSENILNKDIINFYCLMNRCMGTHAVCISIWKCWTIHTKLFQRCHKNHQHKELKKLKLHPLKAMVVISWLFILTFDF